MISTINGLHCTVCRSGHLDFTLDAVICRTCGQEHPVLGGVPIMFAAVSVQAQPAPHDDLGVHQVVTAFELPNDPITLLRVRTLLRTKVRFGNALVQVESQQFLHRVRNSGHDVDVSTTHATPRETLRDLVTVPRYRWTKSYMPRRLAAGTPFLANMRLENCGGVPLYTSGEGNALVALQWQHRDGTPASAPDQRTPLPIDLAPGQAVTLPVSVAPPVRHGAYLLVVTLVQEQVRWLHADAMTFAVTVGQDVPGPVPDGWVVLPTPLADYNADHDRGFELLRDWLKHHAPLQPRVLEIGGNAAPMVSRLGAGFSRDLVNVDVDLLGLQVGRMLEQQRGAGVHHLCADAFDLPFASGYFDAVVIFASLHHFPDPDALLEHLRRKLRPGGFIGLFCEPVGHIWPGDVTAPFLAELERGVNEQSFSLREYELMFNRAELAAAEVLVDMNSLKARLVHVQPDRS